MNKKTMTIVAVVAVLAVCAVAVMAVSSANNKDGECTYSCQQVSSYSMYGLTQYPDTGYKFIKVSGTLSNTDYKNGLSNNPWNFKLNANGVEYSYEWSLDETASATKGASVPVNIIFKVPTSASNYSLIWNGIGTDVDMIKK